MNIEITFMNNSNDTNNSEVTIFQKNNSSNFQDNVIAWKVIQNCGQGWKHKVTVPMKFEVATADSYGNVSSLQSATNGQVWSLVKSPSGETLQLDTDQASSMNEVEIKNDLPEGSIDAQIYKEGRLLAIKTGMPPGEKATFEIEPSIYVGVTQQVVEGEIISPAILNNINQKFSLIGFAKANLIMTGGGQGPNATPFKFDLVPTN